MGCADCHAVEFSVETSRSKVADLPSASLSAKAIHCQGDLIESSPHCRDAARLSLAASQSFASQIALLRSVRSLKAPLVVEQQVRETLDKLGATRPLSGAFHANARVVGEPT